MSARKQTNYWFYHAAVLLDQVDNEHSFPGVSLKDQQLALQEGASALIELGLNSLIEEFLPTPTAVSNWREALQQPDNQSSELMRLRNELIEPEGELRILNQRLARLLGQEAKESSSGAVMIQSDINTVSLSALLKQLKTLANELRETGAEW